MKPYSDAPRLPEGETVDIRDVVKGAWIEVELGPGRGGFIVERASAAPESGLIGLEVRRKWASIVDARLGKMGMHARARVFAEDARVALPRIRPDASVRRFYAHFPDPWWKKRHQKRLMLSAPVIDQIARLLEPGGELFIQTDVEERAAQYRAVLSGDPRFSASPVGDNPYGARSPRERRAIADGLPIQRIRFTRVA